jgi:hypothetical protein
MTTFSSSNQAVRAYIGDLKAADVGMPGYSQPMVSYPTASTKDSEKLDTFTQWAGPLVYIYSKNESVHLSLVDGDASKDKDNDLEDVVDIADAIPSTLSMIR